MPPRPKPQTPLEAYIRSGPALALPSKNAVSTPLGSLLEIVSGSLDSLFVAGWPRLILRSSISIMRSRCEKVPRCESSLCYRMLFGKFHEWHENGIWVGKLLLTRKSAKEGNRRAARGRC